MPAKSTVPSPSPIRILIADDHRIVRDGLKQLFAQVDTITVVAEACDGSQLWQAIETTPIDLLLLDLLMPGAAADKSIKALRRAYPDLHILVLSMHNEPQIVRRTIDAGADGYLTKDCTAETLLAAIATVARGGHFLDPLLAEALAFATVAAPQAPNLPSLTPREAAILRGLVSGNRVCRIALELGLSNKTVSTHKARLMKKLGVTTLADLIKLTLGDRQGRQP